MVLFVLDISLKSNLQSTGALVIHDLRTGEALSGLIVRSGQGPSLKDNDKEPIPVVVIDSPGT